MGRQGVAPGRETQRADQVQNARVRSRFTGQLYPAIHKEALIHRLPTYPFAFRAVISALEVHDGLLGEEGSSLIADFLQDRHE